MRNLSPHQPPVKPLGEEAETFLNSLSHHFFPLMYCHRSPAWFPSPIVLHPPGQCSFTHHKYRFLFELERQKKVSTFLGDISLLSKPNKPLRYLPNSYFNTWQRAGRLTLELKWLFFSDFSTWNWNYEHEHLHVATNLVHDIKGCMFYFCFTLRLQSTRKTKDQKIKFIPFNPNTIRYGSYIQRSKIGNLRGDSANKNRDGMMKSFTYLRYI